MPQRIGIGVDVELSAASLPAPEDCVSRTLVRRAPLSPQPEKFAGSTTFWGVGGGG